MISPSQSAYHMQVIPWLTRRLSAYQEQLFLHVVSKVICGAFRRLCTHWRWQERGFSFLVLWTKTIRNLKKTVLFSEIDNLSNGQDTPQRLWKQSFSTMVPPLERLFPMHPVLVVTVTYTGPFATFDKTLDSLRYEVVPRTNPKWEHFCFSADRCYLLRTSIHIHSYPPH